MNSSFSKSSRTAAGPRRAVLGIGSLGHDSSAALVDADSGVVLHAVAEERLTNIKHDWHFPIGAITKCRQIAKTLGVEIQLAAVNFRSEEFVQKTLSSQIKQIVSDTAAAQKLTQFISNHLPKQDYLSVEPPNHSALSLLSLMNRLQLDDVTKLCLMKRMTWYWNWAVKYRRIAKAIVDEMADVPVQFVNHHEAHAASAFFNSGMDAATVIVLDGSGEADTVTVYRGEAGELQRVSETCWPHSLGIFYLFATQHLGFHLGDEYKVMGMSAYGKPVYVDLLREMMSVDSEARLWLHETEHLRLTDLPPTGHIAFQFTDALRALLPPRQSGQPIEQRHFDFAASVQTLTEEIGVSIARQAINLTGLPRLALAGGVALNGLMNEAIRRSSGCDDIFVYPAAADDGCSVGAAQLAISRTNIIQQPRIRSCYFGHDVTDIEISDVIESRKIVSTRPKSIHQQIALALAEGCIVARCVSKAEFGPRALGHRSLLAHPGLTDMKEILNARVKHREEFRPFAPACLKERVGDYFELEEESPFMLLIGKAKEQTHNIASSVVHADGTARVQTVCEDQNEDLYKVIVEFESLTGLPIVINTSFNVNGEAIVDTAEDALESFAYMDVDYLALGDHWISKEENDAILPKLSSEEYLAIRKQRFREKNLGQLTDLDIAKFDTAFTPGESSIREFCVQRNQAA